MSDETTRLRALLERAALPACEARLCEAGPLPWPAWYVMPVAATIRDGERIAEVMWDGPGLWSNDATATVATARAELFAAIPTALPGLLDAAERAERADALLDSAGRRILNLTAERNGATERAERAEHMHATVLASLTHALAQGDALNAEAKDMHDRMTAAEVRATGAERERDDLAATLETRTAEHALAMARMRELEALVVQRVAAITERDVLRAQQAPLLDAHDALVAAARAAGWTGAGATGEELVAWVRRGAAEECAARCDEDAEAEDVLGRRDGAWALRFLAKSIRVRAKGGE